MCGDETILSLCALMIEEKDRNVLLSQEYSEREKKEEGAHGT
jgi:hypothetical protein